MKERRKDPRVKTPEKFQIKARVRSQDNSETIYFKVVDLSMGGISFVAETERPFKLTQGQIIDLLIYRKNISLRTTAEVLEGATDDKVRARIIGIDEYGREVLAEFLKKMAAPEPA